MKYFKILFDILLLCGVGVAIAYCFLYVHLYTFAILSILFLLLIGIGLCISIIEVIHHEIAWRCPKCKKLVRVEKDANHQTRCSSCHTLL